MKNKWLRNAAIVLIIMQLLAYYGRNGKPFSHYYSIGDLLGSNFFLSLGLIFLSIYWFTNRKKSADTDKNAENNDK